MKETLFGKTEKHLVTLSGTPRKLHKEALDPFLELRESARTQGFEIYIESSYRSFERQKLIWEEKCSGLRPLFDKRGNEINLKNLSKSELLFTLLHWSAIPGTSRHHWGTELDIYDRLSLPPDYKVQLIPSENNKGGIFYDFHQWLSEIIKEDKSFGFFRPYEFDVGGVASELWHISYAPVSEEYLNLFSMDLFLELIRSENFSLKDEIIKNSERIYFDYIAKITPPPFAKS